MNRRLLTLTVLLGTLAFLPASAAAKSADDYYHGAAYQYVAGKIQEASVEAEEGLRLHPGDTKLRALAEQLRKMKDEQRGNSGKGDDKKDKKDKDNKDNKDGENKGDQKDPESKDGDKAGQDDGKQPPKPGEDDSEPDDKDERDGQGRTPQGQMSEEEAKRLLNSFADDEKKEQAERRKVIRQRAGTEQDW